MNKLISGLFISSALLTLSALFCSCNEDGGKDNNERVPIPVSRTEERIVNHYNSFACNLMGQFAKSENYEAGAVPENFISSPLSLSMALSMLANGTDGNTRSEILNALDLNPDDIRTANKLNKKLMDNLPDMDKKSMVRLANALWMDSSIPAKSIQTEFLDILSDCYYAPCTFLDDISSLESMKIINDWAETNTNGVIRDFLKEPLSKNTVFALMNALYFKGQWTKKFDEKKTATEVFHNADGDLVHVKMMHNPSLSCQTYQEDTYKIAALKYGNGAYQLIIVLPNEGLDPVETFADINVEDLTELIKGNFYTTKLDVKLPRFIIESELDMIPMMKGLGMEQAFANGDFSAMFTELTEPLSIGKIKQKARIEVDEEGTEAAAVTIISGELMSPGPMETNEFYVDHPFAFAIAERSTGAILFAGAVRRL